MYVPDYAMYGVWDKARLLSNTDWAAEQGSIVATRRAASTQR